MGWNLKLSDDTTIRLVDFPPSVISGIAVENGVLWSRFVDEPLTNLQASCSLIAWATAAHGLPIPPLATVEQAFDAMSVMFERVLDDDEIPASEEDVAPIAWAG